MSNGHNPINWFEIPVTDMDRAKAFYNATFGADFMDLDLNGAHMAMFPMEMQNPGAGGALIKAESYTPSHAGTMVYFPVPDIEATLAKAAAAGGKTVNPKMAIGEHGHVGHFEDTEGNRVGLHTPPGGMG